MNFNQRAKEILDSKNKILRGAMPPEDKNPLTDAQKTALMHAAKIYELDIALGEISILRGRLYISVAGMLKIAHRSKDFAGIEIKSLAPLSDGEYRYHCIVKRKMEDGFIASFEEIGSASRATAPQRMHIFLDELARTRSKSRALRTAYSISIPSVEEDYESNEEIPEAVKELISMTKDAESTNAEESKKG